MTNISSVFLIPLFILVSHFSIRILRLLIESLLSNFFFAGKWSKSLVERRLAVHLDQINYILSLPNNERYASYLLDYEETYTSFTVDTKN